MTISKIIEIFESVSEMKNTYSISDSISVAVHILRKCSIYLFKSYHGSDTFNQLFFPLNYFKYLKKAKDTTNLWL